MNLTINNYSNTASTTATTCDSYIWDGQAYITSGAYTNTYTNVAGCDSVHTLNLTINYSDTSYTNITACDSYVWDGQTYTVSGVYSNNYTNASGCDSIHTLNLTIYNNTIYDTIIICYGESYVVLTSVYTTSGQYTDSTLNSNGCWSIINTNLTVGSFLSSSITQVGSVLGSTVSGGFTPYTYLWSNANTTPNITISSIGLYWLVITDNVSCSADTVYYEVTNVQTDISEFAINALSIYPNPSRDVFNIKFTSNSRQHFVVRFVNLIGEFLLEDRLDDFIGEYTKQIDLTNKAKGIYFLEIETENGVITKKLILQ